uniref:Uncharacterized protein n=1 Tax=Arundo donax TaxID=35708 RepID=A0A0A9DD65_ARUDO
MCTIMRAPNRTSAHLANLYTETLGTLLCIRTYMHTLPSHLPIHRADPSNSHKGCTHTWPNPVGTPHR